MILVTIFTTLGVILAFYIGWWWMRRHNARNKLASWMPTAPGYPIIGSVFEFGDNTVFTTNIHKLTDNPCKSCYVELMGEWMLLTRDHDLLDLILSSNKILTKGGDYRTVEAWLGKGLLTSNGSQWKAHRKMITPAFHFTILEQFVDVFNSQSDTLVEHLRREALGKSSFDIYHYVTACALDIICETAMGVNLNSQENHDQEYVKAVKDMCRIAMDKTFSLWKGWDFLFNLSSQGKLQEKVLAILHHFTNSVIEQRRKEIADKQEDAKQDDVGRKRKMAFLDLLLNTHIDGRPLTQEEIRAEVDTFMFAGHDTTSSAMSSAFYVLAKNPRIQKMVRDELQAVFGKDGSAPITHKDLQELKYLDVVIKEVLRLYPPATVISRVIEEDLQYKNHTIPKNTLIEMVIYSANRDPDYHENAEVFNPERFLDNSGKKMPFNFIPFSAGPRNCIGQKFAMLEMKTIISKVLMNFEVVPAVPEQEMILTTEVVLKAKNGVHLQLKPL